MLFTLRTMAKQLNRGTVDSNVYEWSVAADHAMKLLTSHHVRLADVIGTCTRIQQ